jgi:hypothetical protein
VKFGLVLLTFCLIVTDTIYLYVCIDFLSFFIPKPVSMISVERALVKNYNLGQRRLNSPIPRRRCPQETGTSMKNEDSASVLAIER